MMTNLMFYGAAVALLIGLAALALERAAAWRRLPRRGLWAAALLLSVALPTLAVLTPKRAMVPAVVVSAPPSSSMASNTAAPTARTPSTKEPIATGAILPRGRMAWPVQLSIERGLRPFWFAASLALVTFYALLWLRMQFAARHWRRERINDQDVWVTQALGPAVYGFMKPIILMPQWAFDAPNAVRAVVLAHEQEHIAARDSWLLLLGLLLVVVAPWNAPLWWQLRRLRFAMEVDCDARVLGRGADARAYGEVLLTIGQRRTFTPVGAIALTEPASQLLRRIRIMTARLPKRGKWAVGAAIGLSLTCLAVAAELRAPTLRLTAVTGEPSAGALLKPPVGEDPRLPAVQDLVRATYPELFSASAPPGPVLVTLFLNQDGTLYKSFKEDIEPTPWIANSLKAFEVMGVDFEHRGVSVRLRMQGWSEARNHIDVRAWYLKAASDPSRDVALVRAKVKARYASLLRPSSGDSASVVTVFMTETGDLDRVKVEAAKDIDPQTLATPEHFVAMGIARDRIGPIGTTVLSDLHFTDDRDPKTLPVVYAWPRRPDEPEPKHELPEQPAAAAANDDPAVNRSIAEHYFADLYTFPKEWPRADPWVLLDRQGKVLKTGRRVAMSGWDVKLYLESLYPGLRTDGVQVATVRGDHGEWADVGFVWLAADSPITDPSKADLSKRSDLFFYADVKGEGMTRSTNLLVLKVGSPAVAVCSRTNPFGVVHVQVTATEPDAEAVALRIRVQHVPLGITADESDAVETKWSPESSPVRVPYGGSAEVQVTDQDRKTWTIVLYPDQLKGAS